MSRRHLALALVLTLAPALTHVTPGLAQTAGGPREIEVVVERGYDPSRIVVTEGERVRLRFVRRESSGCTRVVVFPSLGLRRELPVNVPVVIELPPLAPGEVAYHCGMRMIRGVIVVQPRAGADAG